MLPRMALEFVRNHSIASALGRISERWRFKYEDSTKARQHAPHSALSEAHLDVSTGTWGDIPFEDKYLETDGDVFRELCDPNEVGGPPWEDSNSIAADGFSEIPLSILRGDKWNVIQSCPWKYEETYYVQRGGLLNGLSDVSVEP